MAVKGFVLEVETSDQLPVRRFASLVVGLVAVADQTWMVKVPVVTTLAIDEPEIRPVRPEATTAALAGPPRR